MRESAKRHLVLLWKDLNQQSNLQAYIYQRKEVKKGPSDTDGLPTADKEGKYSLSHTYDALRTRKG